MAFEACAQSKFWFALKYHNLHGFSSSLPLCLFHHDATIYILFKLTERHSNLKNPISSLVFLFYYTFFVWIVWFSQHFENVFIKSILWLDEIIWMQFPFRSECVSLNMLKAFVGTYKLAHTKNTSVPHINQMELKKTVIRYARVEDI